MTKAKASENKETKENKETQNPVEETQQNSAESAQEECVGDKMAEDCQGEVKEWQDKYMRLSAEFDNFRKRTLREKADLAQYGGADVLKAILPTLDDFDRALPHITDENTKSGMELIHSKLLNSLQGQGVKEMTLIGEVFDVDYAEAIAKMPAQSPEDSGKIMDVAQKGYMLGEKVLRFAKVVVFE